MKRMKRKRWQPTQPGPSLPQAPGVRMTVVNKLIQISRTGSFFPSGMHFVGSGCLVVSFSMRPFQHGADKDHALAMVSPRLQGLRYPLQ
eukprot:11248714-Karenia_brevis.AAC.1